MFSSWSRQPVLFLQYHRLWVEHVANRDMLWHHCLVWTRVCLLQESTPTVSSASFCAANHGVHPEYTGSLKTALWEYHVKHVSPFWGCWVYFNVHIYVTCTRPTVYPCWQKEAPHQSIVLRLSCDVSVYWYQCTAPQLARTFLLIVCTTFSLKLQLNYLHFQVSP